MEHSISGTIFFGPIGVPLIGRILYFTTFPSASIIDIEKVNISWVRGKTL